MGTVHSMKQETRTRVEEIVWLETQADRVLAEAPGEANRVLTEAASRSDEYRWEAARLYSEESQTKTQQEIAGETGKTQQHVSYMIQALRLRDYKHACNSAHETFDSYYQEAMHGQGDIKGRREERARKVRDLAAQGVSGRAIGKRLGIDERTVRDDLKSDEKRTEDRLKAIWDTPSAACIRNGPFREWFEDDLDAAVGGVNALIQRCANTGNGFCGNESGMLRLELKRALAYLARCEEDQEEGRTK